METNILLPEVAEQISNISTVTSHCGNIFGNSDLHLSGVTYIFGNFKSEPGGDSQCSIDPYIFGNFESAPGGDSLSAKFRAFKFPDANHVLFVGSVSVCLQECRGVPCGNGQLGYGRRKRRSVPTDLPPDPNKMFEVEMTTVLRVQYPEQHFTLNKGSLTGDGSQQKIENNTINDNSSIVGSYVPPEALHTEEHNSAISLSMSILIIVTSLLLLINI